MPTERFTIDERFCGPPKSGNGGYTAGRLAAHLPGTVAVRLKAPPPLGVELRLESGDSEAKLFAGDALIGEAHQYPEEARRMVGEAVLPLRERLQAYLHSAQKAGTVRADLALAPAIDAFTGMLLSEMLRRTGKARSLSYSAEKFIQTAVGIFAAGIAVTKE